jgi:hypothetical protein
MARRRRSPRARSRPAAPRPRSRRRRRLAGAAGVLAGALLAAGSGWVYAASGGPDVAARPAPSRAGHHHPPLLPPPAADLAIRHGVLDIPVVDWTEVLPSCHN